MTPVAEAESLVKQFINGNREHVRNRFREMEGQRAACIAAYMVDQILPLNDASYQIGSFLRCLSDELNT